MVSAEFTSDCEGRSFYVRGEGPDGFNLKPTLVKVTGGKFTYPKTELGSLTAPYTKKKFESLKVRHFPNFTIKWYFFDKEDGIFRKIGESNHPLYVTHKKPINTQVIHSFLFISCKSANNKNAEDDVMSTIYDDFTDQCVKKYNGSKCMGYWVEPKPPQGGTANDACFTGIALVAWENATCGAWADLHVELVKTQGLGYIKPVTVLWKDLAVLESNSSELNLLESNLTTFFGSLVSNVMYYTSNGSDYKPADFYVKNYSFANGLEKLASFKNSLQKLKEWT